MTKKFFGNRIISILLAVIFSICWFVTPVRAEDGTMGDGLLDIETNDIYCLNDYENAVAILDLVDDLSDSSGIALLSEENNTAPVAGLTLVLSNPESLVNNKVSTDSVIFWLWKDGDTYLTYDPDDNSEISQFYINGLNEFIIGYVSDGSGETVGFATKITVPAEHFLTYYVVDKYGSKSNVLNYRIEVEPADGNQRPECAISASNTRAFAGEKVYFDCSPSTDPDGDDITNIKIKVIAGNQEIYAIDSPYFLGISGTVVTMKFDETGIYGLRFAVQDSRGAWSNWVGGDFVVTARGPADAVMSLGVDWVGQKSVKWTSGNTTSNHTMTSRLSTVMVYPNQRRVVKSYTNYKGTYRNVIAYPVAPGTHFMSRDTLWNANSGMQEDKTDPFFGLETTRVLTADEIIAIRNSSRWKNHIYIIYDPNKGEIIDFYSPLNPIIGKFWDEPTLLLYD